MTSSRMVSPSTARRIRPSPPSVRLIASADRCPLATYSPRPSPMSSVSLRTSAPVPSGWPSRTVLRSCLQVIRPTVPTGSTTRRVTSSPAPTTALSSPTGSSDSMPVVVSLSSSRMAGARSIRWIPIWRVRPMLRSMSSLGTRKGSSPLRSPSIQLSSLRRMVLGSFVPPPSGIPSPSRWLRLRSKAKA